MKNNPASPAFALACAFLLQPFSFIFAQGPLTPPGAPAPTMKTLDEIEPRINIQRAINPLPNDGSNHFIISSPGSYYLSANLGVTRTNGIHVTAPDVTIDLNGFQITRNSGAGGDGIIIDPAANRCTVKNGSVIGFSNGIECVSSNPDARGGRFSQLSVSSCTSAALRAGDAWQIDGCTVHNNASGIFTGDAATIRDFIAYGNTSTVISPGSGSVLTRCSAHSNNASLIFALAQGCIVTDCNASLNSGVNTAAIQMAVSGTLTNFSAYNNIGTGAAIRTLQGQCTLTNCSAGFGFGGLRGFLVFSGTTLTNCTATGNSGGGIITGDGCSLTNCTALSNSGTFGLQTGSNSTLSHCTASLNTSASATSSGIQGGDNCTLTDCTAAANTSTNASPTDTTGAGISVGDGCSLNHCTTNENNGDGLELGARCEVVGCNSSGNGNGANGSGIVGGLRTVLKNCTAADNRKSGIVVLSASLVSENNASHNGVGVSAAGIDSSGGSGSRIEANHTRNNSGTGILGASNDVIIRNYSFSNTTNYNPSSGANFGPIESPSTSTHPTANF